MASSRLSTCSASLSTPSEFLYDAFQYSPASSTRTSTTTIGGCSQASSFIYRVPLTKGSLLVQEAFYSGDPVSYDNKSIVFER